MDAEAIGKSKIVNLIFKPSGWTMDSRFRHWLFNPVKTLQGADIQPGQTILELGCGPGFFTIPLAKMIGDQGTLIAMDINTGFLDQVSKKVQKADLKNVQIIRRDALKTGLETASIDKVLIFGVLPFPLLPLDKLLPEMHRILKPEGTMAIWLYPPFVHFYVPKSILRSGLFTDIGKRNGIWHGIYNFKRS